MVKRYEVTEKYIGTGEYVGAMVVCSDGDYVEHIDYAAIASRLADAERLLLKFHTGGPMAIAALIDEVPEFLGIAGWQRECICGPDETRGDCPEHGRFCIHGRLLDAHECDQPDTSRGSLRVRDSATVAPAEGA